MKWHHPLYMGEEAEKKRKKLMRQMERKHPSPGVYAVTLASNGTDLLDVLPSFMLMRDDIFEREILGLAVTKDEAYEVCEQIIMDVYKETGDFKVRSYFS